MTFSIEVDLLEVLQVETFVVERVAQKSLYYMYQGIWLSVYYVIIFLQPI